MLSKRFLSTAAPLAFLALAGMGLATAQSSSPFASGNKVQAWEQPSQAAPAQSYQAPAYSAPVQTAPSYNYAAPASGAGPVSSDAPIATNPRASAPAYASYSATTPPKTYGRQSAPSYQAPSYQTPAARSYAPPPRANSAANSVGGSATPPAGSNYSYTPPRQTQTAQAPNYGSPTPPAGNPRYGSAPAAQPSSRPSSGSPYAPQPRAQQQWTPPSSSAVRPSAPQAQGQGQAQAQGWGTYENTRPSQTQAQYGQQGYTPPSAQNYGYQSSTPPTGVPPTGSPYPYPGGPYTPAPQRPRSWKDKLGLGNLATVLRGAFTVGAAATNRKQPDNQLGPDDGWSEDFIGDGELELEVSAITQGGLEYGINLGGKGQYDPYRRGFGGQTPDCPPTLVGCSGQAAASATGLRGHTSGFYSGGEDIAKDAQFALESAHIFLRSAYGDVTIGRDDGAAYLFSLGAPTLLAVGASNSPVDYTGYDSVKTINEASGFGEKITYTSPRLLGDQIGVGVQLGVSYALDGDVCGVDYCNGKNITGITQPEIEDIMEAGLALDRTFENGLRVEWTGTYARGSEKSGLAGLDDLESFGTGLEFGYGDWTLGGSYLNSNNGLLDGDYSAYDAGITWQPGVLGFTLGYGHAEDDNVGLKSDQGTFGITYEFDKFTLGTGVQHVDREVSGVELGLPTTLDQKATSIFVQGGFKF